MYQVKIFLFVISILFSIRLIAEFTIKLFQDNPEPLVLSKIQQVLIYLAASYIITFILT
jgi:Na+-driven multidrug efflux pump